MVLKHEDSNIDRYTGQQRSRHRPAPPHDVSLLPSVTIEYVKSFEFAILVETLGSCDERDRTQ